MTNSDNDNHDVSCDLDPAVETKGVQEILAELTDKEQKAMPDQEMPLRHFRAEKGNTTKAVKQLKATLAWSKDFELDTLRDCFQNIGREEESATCDTVDNNSGTSTAATSPTSSNNKSRAKEFREMLLKENETAKVYVRGYDEDGRAVVYMRPGLENTNIELNNMRHLVWNMEKAIAISQRNGHSKIVFVIDYEGFSLFNTPPMSTVQLTMDIFQKHYPERCHKFYLTHPPFIFKAFWAAAKVFIDPHTKNKIIFCSGASGNAILQDKLGGNHEECAGGDNTANIKKFDRHEYFNLPLEENFDDANWPKFNQLQS